MSTLILILLLGLTILISTGINTLLSYIFFHKYDLERDEEKDNEAEQLIIKSLIELRDANIEMSGRVYTLERRL